MIARRESFPSRLLLLHLPVFLIVFFALGPYIWSMISSITPEKDFGTAGFRYFPVHPTLENYARLFSRINFAKNIMVK